MVRVPVDDHGPSRREGAGGGRGRGHGQVAGAEQVAADGFPDAVDAVVSADDGEPWSGSGRDGDESLRFAPEFDDGELDETGAPAVPAGERSLLRLVDPGIVLLGFAAVELAAFGTLGFVDVEPHPYWLVVLVAAASRGVAAGMVSALGATALFVVGLGIQGTLDHWMQLLDLERMFVPVLWCGTAYLVGEVRDASRARVRRLEREIEWLELSERRLRRDHDVLDAANRELRRRLFEEGSDFDGMIQALSTVDRVSEAALFEMPLEVAADRCGATKCSVLAVLPDGKVDLARHVGWSNREIRSRIEDANASPLVRRAVSDSTIAHCFAPDAEAPERGPLLVVPVLDGSGLVRALLCLDEIRATAVGDSVVQTFVSIAEWLTAAVRQGIGREAGSLEESLRRMLQGQREIGTPEELAQRLTVEDVRAVRQGRTAALVSVHFRNVDVQRPGDLEALDRLLLQRLANDLRLSDDLFRFGFPGYYLLVLAATPRARALEIAERLDVALAGADRDELHGAEVSLHVPDAEFPMLSDLLPRITREYFAGEAPPDVRCPVPMARPRAWGRAADFGRRLRIELGVARRSQQDLALLDFRSRGRGEMDMGCMVARHLTNTPSEVLRAGDGIFVVAENRCVVLLVDIDCDDAGRVWRRVLDQLAATMPREWYDALESDFLAVEGADAEVVADYLLGQEQARLLRDEAQPAVPAPPLLSMEELDHLSETMQDLVSWTREIRFGDERGLYPVFADPDVQDPFEVAWDEAFGAATQELERVRDPQEDWRETVGDLDRADRRIERLVAIGLTRNQLTQLEKRARSIVTNCLQAHSASEGGGPSVPEADSATGVWAPDPGSGGSAADGGRPASTDAAAEAADGTHGRSTTRTPQSAAAPPEDGAGPEAGASTLGPSAAAVPPRGAEDVPPAADRPAAGSRWTPGQVVTESELGALLGSGAHPDPVGGESAAGGRRATWNDEGQVPGDEVEDRGDGEDRGEGVEERGGSGGTASPPGGDR